MGYTIGVDVGGTKVLGGVVDESGKVIETARRDTPKAGGSGGRAGAGVCTASGGARTYSFQRAAATARRGGTRR